jgi:prolyl-tRNA editing enzyme YbaK/EbsC (Cys-tRNA(Pro) deacylase)
MASSPTVDPEVHDVIELAGRRVGDISRTGEILEVLGDRGRRHFRVRWDDGHESLYYPVGEIVVRRARHRLPSSTAALLELLEQADVGFELLVHERTQTAESEARVLGLVPQDVAKTVIVRADGACVRAVVPSSCRLDLEKLAAVLGTELVLLTESELDGAYPQFELGAVPPFGGPSDRVVIDATLVDAGYIVIEAGAHDASLRLRPRDLVELTRAQVADIARR